MTFTRMFVAGRLTSLGFLGGPWPAGGALIRLIVADRFCDAAACRNAVAFLGRFPTTRLHAGIAR